jgi:UV DNA damage endonuclease
MVFRLYSHRERKKALRFRLCCIFNREPICFRYTTAKAVSVFGRSQQLAKLSEICLANAASLFDAFQAVSSMGNGAFRVLSPTFPRYTLADEGYGIDDLPGAGDIRELLERVNDYRKSHNIRVSFHPDQFVTISSPRTGVVGSSLRELENQGLVKEDKQ